MSLFDAYLQQFILEDNGPDDDEDQNNQDQDTNTDDDTQDQGGDDNEATQDDGDDDADEFSIDGDGNDESNTDYPDADVAAQSDDGGYATDQGGDDNGGSDDEDEFSMDGGDDDEGSSDPGSDSGNDDGGDATDSGGGDSSDENNDTDDGGDEFSMDGDDGDTDQGGDDDSTSGGTDSGSDVDDNDPSSKLKSLEDSIFNQLSPEQQKSKIKELKNLYDDVYDRCQTVINMVASSEKDPQHAKVYDYVVNSIVDLQKYIRDYLSSIFDSKTYIENMTELQKYLAILDTVSNVFKEIKNSIKDDDK